MQNRYSIKCSYLYGECYMDILLKGLSLMLVKGRRFNRMVKPCE